MKFLFEEFLDFLKHLKEFRNQRFNEAMNDSFFEGVILGLLIGNSDVSYIHKGKTEEQEEEDEE